MVSMFICTMSVAQENIFRESKEIKAVIFDCDGTLVDSEQAHFLAWRYAFQNQGYELTEQEYMTFVGKGHLIVLQMAIDMIGFDCSKELSKDKEEYFGKLQLTGIPPISSTVEFLHLLAKEKNKYGIKLAVASGARKKEILHHLKNLEIESYFDVVLSGYDDLAEYEDSEGTNKPKPYIYLKTAKMLGFSPVQCVAIEDSHPGVSSAVSAGCITIAIPNHYTQNHDLSHASLKIDSFANLSINDFFDKIANSAFSQPQESVLK